MLSMLSTKLPCFCLILPHVWVNDFRPDFYKLYHSSGQLLICSAHNTNNSQIVAYSEKTSVGQKKIEPLAFKHYIRIFKLFILFHDENNHWTSKSRSLWWQDLGAELSLGNKIFHAKYILHIYKSTIDALH